MSALRDRTGGRAPILEGSGGIVGGALDYAGGYTAFPAVNPPDGLTLSGWVRTDNAAGGYQTFFGPGENNYTFGKENGSGTVRFWFNDASPDGDAQTLNLWSTNAAWRRSKNSSEAGHTAISRPCSPLGCVHSSTTVDGRSTTTSHSPEWTQQCPSTTALPAGLV